ncbi:PKD domain-containing protein [Methanoculleus sp. 10]|uniref:PKD domain-containing protein n=1 Tax=Methanoculleus sp. 10 TaxID=430615 RepID=UPI0025DAF6E1|nr:PKD domain-containing protein [Methanoculleus sp. 10]
MRVRRAAWICILLLLIGTASAVPLLPAEFRGSVTIDGSPAPAGTVITARIDGRDCGSLTLESAGVYGGDATFDKRLLVCGRDDDAEKTIAFFVDGARAAGTAVYTSGTSTRLDLAVTSGAGFTADATAGPAPLTVRFTDESSGDPKSWSWVFGDGGTSAEQNPVYTYRTPGTYTVNLTVDNSATLSRPDYITVTAPKGDFGGDGVVDIGDVSKVAYMVVGKAAVDPAADFNGNGVVDIGDAAKIAYFFVGKIEAL